MLWRTGMTPNALRHGALFMACVAMTSALTENGAPEFGVRSGATEYGTRRSPEELSRDSILRRAGLKNYTSARVHWRENVTNIMKMCSLLKLQGEASLNWYLIDEVGIVRIPGYPNPRVGLLKLLVRTCSTDDGTELKPLSAAQPAGTKPSSTWPFVRLSGPTDCCSWAVAGDVGHMHGRFAGSEQHRSAAACALLCLDKPHCTYFAHEQKARRCVMCSGCDAKPSQGYSAWAVKRSVANAVVGNASYDQQLQNAKRALESSGEVDSGVNSSTSRDQAGWERVDVGNVVSALLPRLNGTYSMRLYGMRGRVPPVDTLRLVWLNLLPATDRARLERHGLCYSQSLPPFYPFYVLQGRPVNLNALWRTNDEAPAPARASHSWVEVTHCALPGSMRGQHAWKHGLFWLFVAPGSGLSVNIGRTRAVASFEEGMRILKRMYPGEVDERCNKMQGRANLSGTEYAEYDDIDSLQILQHQEYFSVEQRHEIILLESNQSECDPVRASTKFFKCGRFPHLDQCSSEAIRRHQCHPQGSKYRDNGALSNSTVEALSRSACNWSTRSRCFRVSGQEYSCPAGEAARLGLHDAGSHRSALGQN